MENALGKLIVDAAISVHKALGPGLLESAYEACLAHELSLRDVVVERQVSLPVIYKGIRIEAGYRLDILVNERVVVEVKAVEHVLPVHSSQLLSYLRLGDYRLGLLLNFNVALMRDGIKRIVNGMDE
jgi:GxxExxY protein